MAMLTDAEKVILLRAVEHKANQADIPQRWAKACLYDSAQAVEDILSGAAFESGVSAAIDSAAAPYGITFTNTEKRWLTAIVMELKHTRDILG